MEKQTPSSGLPPLEPRQIAIMAAILLAATLTGFYTRLFQIALPDLRGVWGLSLDEGSILNTMAVAPQMLIAPGIPWLVTVLGIRRVLMPSALLFILLTLATPFINGFPALLVVHGLVGLLLGVFIPATLVVLFHNVPPPWWVFPLSIFVFRLSLTTNTGVSISAFYTEYVGWQWIYWQSALLMLIYLWLLRFYAPETAARHDLLEKIDFSGMVFFGLGSTLIYVGADQGERLGWFDSGFVSLCFIFGAAFLLLFVINEKMSAEPWAPLSVLTSRNSLLVILLIGVYAFLVAVNSAMITLFLGSIHALKPLQTGDVLLVTAAVHALLIPLSIYVIRRVDPRLCYGFGMTMFALACLKGGRVTTDWMAADFIPLALCFALAHPFAFIAILAMAIGNFNREKTTSLLAFVQIGRILIPALGGVLISVCIRIRSDSHWLFLSESLIGNNPHLSQMQNGQGLNVEALISSVKLQATVLAFQDTFNLCFWAAMLGLAIVLLMRPTPPNPIFTSTAPAAVRGPAKFFGRQVKEI